MPFTIWFKADGTLQDLSPEDLKREEHRLRIREEQLVARLQKVLGEKEAAFRVGAENRSLSLRRILARRFAGASAEQDSLEQELLRLGKDLMTVRAFLRLGEAGKRPKGVGDAVAELQVAYEDDRTGEAAFRDALFRSLGMAPPEQDLMADVFKVWRSFDKGEYAGVDDARRALDENGSKEAK